MPGLWVRPPPAPGPPVLRRRLDRPRSHPLTWVPCSLLAMAGWIKGAIKRPGAFRAKAQRAGMSTSAYARKVAHDPRASTRTKRQAALARTLGKMRHKRRGGRAGGR